MSQCIKELSLDDRPREKLMQQGAAGLSNSELLAILIRTGTQKRSALRIAEELTASSGLYQNIACWLKSRDWGPQKLQQFWLRWN